MTHIPQSRLVQYRDGQITAAPRAAVAAHLAVCERCRGELRRMDREMREQAASLSAADGLQPLLESVAGWSASGEVERYLATSSAAQVRYFLGARAADDLLLAGVRPDAPPVLDRAERLLAAFLGREAAATVASRIVADAASGILSSGKTRP